MASENSVPFKVYLIQSGKTEQVRRFSIDKDVVTNFSYLKQKLTTIFPMLQTVGAEIFWKDMEGDSVQICSDEELVLALTELEGPFKKLYVVPGPGVRNVKFPPGFPFHAANINEGPTVHIGVTCDACQRQIVGNRYKCGVCPDYDLCSDCEHKQLHKEHFMIRLPFPLDGSTMGYKVLKEACKMAKNMEKAAHHSMKHMNKEKHHWHKKGHKHGPCPYPRNFVHNFNDSEQSSGDEKPEEAPKKQEETIDFFGLVNQFIGPNSQFLSKLDKGIEDLTKKIEITIATPEQPEPMDTTTPKEGGKEEAKKTPQPTPTPPTVIPSTSSAIPLPPAYPSVVDLTEENGWSILNRQPKTKIDESLEKMISMGFNNEGNWLREMLISTDGDIPKVVDKLMNTKFA